jgi:ATP-dependent Lhr-like helicase
MRALAGDALNRDGLAGGGAGEAGAAGLAGEAGGPDARLAFPGALGGSVPSDDPRRAVVLAAADPAQPYGAALAWPARPEETATSHRPGRKAGAVVVLFGGELVLYVERGGKTLLSWTDNPVALEPCARALATAVRDGALGRITVEKADGGMLVLDSPLTRALESAGFRHTPRGLRLRG